MFGIYSNTGVHACLDETCRQLAIVRRKVMDLFYNYLELALEYVIYFLEVAKVISYFAY